MRSIIEQFTFLHKYYYLYLLLYLVINSNCQMREKVFILKFLTVYTRRLWLTRGMTQNRERGSLACTLLWHVVEDQWWFIDSVRSRTNDIPRKTTRHDLCRTGREGNRWNSLSFSFLLFSFRSPPLLPSLRRATTKIYYSGGYGKNKVVEGVIWIEIDLHCSGSRGFAEGVPGGVRYCEGENAAYAPDQARPCPQLLRFLLRNY